MKHKKNKSNEKVMPGNSFVFYCTFYDLEAYRKAIAMLAQNGIDFQVSDNSNPMNYRIPSSTYTEIGLYISFSCYDQADIL